MTTVAALMNLLRGLTESSVVYCIADDKRLILMTDPQPKITPEVKVSPMGYEWQE